MSEAQYGRVESAPPPGNWFQDPRLHAVFAALTREGAEARLVGGAIRNDLLGAPIDDLDMATTALPEKTMARAQAAGMKAVGTGLDHGTVTVIHEALVIEITTLRADIATDGRHADVRFGTDWREDAARRDFTMNALYRDAAGTLYDPTGLGFADVMSRRLRFIGDADARIREDYLRILRFFRFYAQYPATTLDEEGLHACLANRAGLAGLSRERIANELKKLLMGRAAERAADALAKAGLAEKLLKSMAFPRYFARMQAALTVCERTGPRPLSPDLVWIARLAAFGLCTKEGVGHLQAALRLSNQEAGHLGAIASLAEMLAGADNLGQKQAAHKAGAELTQAAILLHWVWSGGKECQTASTAFRALITLAEKTFPVHGRDLIAAGITPGPDMGKALQKLKDIWLMADGAPDKAALLREHKSRGVRRV